MRPVGLLAEKSASLQVTTELAWVVVIVEVGAPEPVFVPFTAGVPASEALVQRSTVIEWNNPVPEKAQETVIAAPDAVTAVEIFDAQLPAAADATGDEYVFP